MSLHAEGDQVLFGAPGSYTWKGTIAASRHSRFQLGGRVKNEPSSIYDYSGYSVGTGTDFFIPNLQDSSGDFTISALA